MYDAREIANFFLECADRDGKDITNMSLLKLIYYAQGWYLKAHNKSLIVNKFEAWQYGPVVREVYDAFKDCGESAIKKRALRFDPKTNGFVVAAGSLDRAVKEFLEKIFVFYSHLTAFELSDMTHENGGPWDKTLKEAEKNISLRLEISNELIKSDFDRKQQLVA